MVHHEYSDALHAQLLRRIAEQDHQAVGEFYDQVAGILFSTAVRILRDTHDAEEIVQEVFIQIWGKARDFDPAKGTAIHWTLAITRHRCLDRLRSRQRRSRLVEEMTGMTAVTESTGAESMHPSSRLLSGEEITAVRAAVAELPPEQRTAIEMAFFSGLSHADIAESLGEPLGTVKARIRRGMMKLRDHLKSYL